MMWNALAQSLISLNAPTVTLRLITIINMMWVFNASKVSIVFIQCTASMVCLYNTSVKIEMKRDVGMVNQQKRGEQGSV